MRSVEVLQIRRLTLVSLALSLSPGAHASDASPTLASAALQTTIGLAFVVAMIIAIAFLVKRLLPGKFHGAQLIRPVASVSIGARERIVVVEIEEQWLVLGVTPASINTLYTMPKGEAAVDSRATALAPLPQNVFANVLRRARGRRSDT